MKTPSHILVGIDFSPASKAALGMGIRLAQSSGAKVTAIHVAEPGLAQEMKHAHRWNDIELAARLDESVTRFVQEAGFSNQDIEFEVRIDPPFTGLVEACRQAHPDLLVMGTRGNAHQANHIGAVAARCVRKAPADVFLVREEQQSDYRNILVCVDFSETSAKAVRTARFIAEQHQAHLTCLFVYQSAVALSLDYGGFMPPLPEDGRISLEIWHKDLTTFVEPLLRTSENLEWKAVVCERVNIREAIVEQITELKADLVVLGTRGKTGLRELVLGTTAERIVNHAPCSVLAVKPEDFTKEPIPAEGPISDDAETLPIGGPLA